MLQVDPPIPATAVLPILLLVSLEGKKDLVYFTYLCIAM